VDGLFFSDWQTLGRTLVIGVLAYVMLIVLLRVCGKRTLSKMNAFDFVVTVAMGSTLATILLSGDRRAADAALPGVAPERRAEKRAHHRRITEEELRACVRPSGMPSLPALEAVVLETDGSLSVIKGSGKSRATSLKGVGTQDQ